MKKIIAFMDWSIFSLRFYHYLLLAILILTVPGDSAHVQLEIIWLLAAFLVPILFWFPQLRLNNLWFCITEVILGGSYYVNMTIHSEFISSPDYLLPSLTMGYLLTRKTVWIIPTVFLLPFVFLFNQGYTLNQSMSIGFDNLLFCFIGIWVSFIANAYRQKNALAVEVAHQNRLLSHYAAQVEKLTLMEERSRMSKELHDTLGHSFISLIMSLDAAIALLDHKPAEVKDRLIRLRALAERNLDEMRDVVHEMGEDENSLFKQIRVLADSFAEHTGTNVTLNLPVTEHAMLLKARQAILRMIQESFTNALKHGKASKLKLELSFVEEALHIVIRNNGKPIDKLEYGFGLTTMKQRIQEIGGKLTLSSSSGATSFTEVRCEIPLNGVMLHAED
ncbi:sensor histidine kinase [Paenibacillus sp. FSL R5-0766]|uniref:sensor histidine kinase n=1 Tax=unclassified Paenibacillus TaxID=185978 RepID=UPI00096E6D54|nr:sensor histidine kinase [Paenibacillus sp. FSL R5-0765]OMF65452.1 two-component sensor histidine kinase [Paenibacillus sp. FSL R5-0765]